jgi:endonuclease G
MFGRGQLRSNSPGLNAEAVVADERELLSESSRGILSRDKDLAARLDVLRGLANLPELRPLLDRVQERVGSPELSGPDPALNEETIVNRIGRPVLEVANDNYLIEGPEAVIWEPRLSDEAVRTKLRGVIPSVGRIEVEHHPDLSWVGTGWLIAADIVVTNRHVAREFAVSSGEAFVFKRGWRDRDTRMAAQIDFRRELHCRESRPFAVREILHIEDDDGPDFAFLKVERTGPAGSLSGFLHPARRKAKAKQYIATIGYPAADSRLPEQELMNRLFGDKYNVKRLAPGQVMRLADDLVLHDCSTLGGNSGSPIVDLATGEVLALHFSGVFLRENRGVPIAYVLNRLKKLSGRPRPAPDRSSGGEAARAAPVPGRRPIQEGTATLTWTIPLQVSITLGTPTGGGPQPAAITVTTGDEPQAQGGPGPNSLSRAVGLPGAGARPDPDGGAAAAVPEPVAEPARRRPERRSVHRAGRRPAGETGVRS